MIMQNDYLLRPTTSYPPPPLASPCMPRHACARGSSCRCDDDLSIELSPPQLIVQTHRRTAFHRPIQTAHRHRLTDSEAKNDHYNLEDIGTNSAGHLPPRPSTILKDCCHCMRYAEVITISAPGAVRIGLLDPNRKTPGPKYDGLFPRSPVVSLTVPPRLKISHSEKFLPLRMRLTSPVEPSIGAQRRMTFERGPCRYFTPFAASDFVYDGATVASPPTTRLPPLPPAVVECAAAMLRTVDSRHNLSVTTSESAEEIAAHHPPGLSLGDEEECCECLCHLTCARYRIGEILHQGFTSTVLACDRIAYLSHPMFQNFYGQHSSESILGKEEEEEESSGSPRYSMDGTTIKPVVKNLRFIDGNDTLEKRVKAAYAWLRPIQSCREIVIKIIHKARCDSQELDRCEEETNFLISLKHPHIVKLLASFDGANELWLFFERSAYMDLAESLEFENRGTSEEEMRHVITQLLQALAFCHNLGIIHGDVKPKNVLVHAAHEDNKPSRSRFNKYHKPSNPRIYTGDWRNAHLKLADFGLATKLPFDRDTVRFAGVQGSHGYFAPEILLRRDYGCKVDIWALGIVAFQMVGGYEPWYPASACISEPLRFNSREWDAVTDSCKEFIQGLLAFSPYDRFSADEALSHPWITRDGGCDKGSPSLSWESVTHDQPPCQMVSPLTITPT